MKTLDPALQYVFPVFRYKYIVGEDRVRIEEGSLYREKGHPYGNSHASRSGVCAKEEDGIVYSYLFFRPGMQYEQYIAAEEGTVYLNTFWLTKRNDKKARQIVDECIVQKNEEKVFSIPRSELGED